MASSALAGYGSLPVPEPVEQNPLLVLYPNACLVPFPVRALSGARAPEVLPFAEKLDPGFRRPGLGVERDRGPLPHWGHDPAGNFPVLEHFDHLWGDRLLTFGQDKRGCRTPPGRRVVVGGLDFGL